MIEPPCNWGTIWWIANICCCIIPKWEGIDGHTRYNAIRPTGRAFSPLSPCLFRLAKGPAFLELINITVLDNFFNLRLQTHFHYHYFSDKTKKYKRVSKLKNITILTHVKYTIIVRDLLQIPKKGIILDWPLFVPLFFPPLVRGILAF